jgi:uncharacterized phage protein gp47/JayE
MPWQTPTLKDTRKLTRDYVLSQLGAVAMIPNSVLRIMSDAMAGLTHLTLLYLDWLAKQLMPDTAEQEWLDRHGVIWLTNADGSKGRKAATYAKGTLQFEGNEGVIIPIGTLLIGSNGLQYQTTTEGALGPGGLSNVEAVALTAGVDGNLLDGTSLTFADTSIPGVTTVICLGDMSGGVDTETDEQLRERILQRIQNPPMGGSEQDYVRWALAVPGVTRAWAATEMGVGTITVRFLMDDLYPDNHGLPQPDDIAVVAAYMDEMRPVTVKDIWVDGPIPFFYSITITELSLDTVDTRGRIQTSIEEMEFRRSRPGQTMYRSWIDEAICNAIGEEHHELLFETLEMPAPGYMPFIDTILYIPTEPPA